MIKKRSRPQPRLRQLSVEADEPEVQEEDQDGEERLAWVSLVIVFGRVEVIQLLVWQTSLSSASFGVRERESI